MKKFLLVTLFMLFLVACSSTNRNDDVKILVPNGIPLVAIGGLMDEDNISIESVTGPDLLVSGMISKSHDIIIAPLNIGVKLYSSGIKNYQMDSIISCGNTYLVSRKENPLNTISDVNNKDILAYGKNSIPDIILNKALDSKNVNASITYQGGIDLVIPFFIGNPNNPNDNIIDSPDYILCAEPIITKLEVEHKMDLNILSLQDDLNSEIDFIPQAAIFVRKESENKELINNVLTLIEENIETLNNNPKEYSKEIENQHQYFINLSADIIYKSIPRSNIAFKKANEYQESINKFLNIVIAFNPDLLGTTVPDKDFYRL